MRTVLIALLLMLAFAASPAASAPGAPPAADHAIAAWPLDAVPAVVHPFAPPPLPWQSGHRGVDLLGTLAADVRAPIAGTVALAGRIVDRGVVVIVSGRLRISLEPVAPAVAVGDVVRAGQVVGTLEGAASHCPPSTCLHVGLRVDASYHDPLLLMQRHRPVLLARRSRPRQPTRRES